MGEEVASRRGVGERTPTMYIGRQTDTPSCTHTHVRTHTQSEEVLRYLRQVPDGRGDLLVVFHQVSQLLQCCEEWPIQVL